MRSPGLPASALLGLLLVSAALAAAPPVEEAAPAPRPAPAAQHPLAWQDARLLAEVLQRVRENYVDTVNDHELMNQAAAGMADGLDEYSGLLSAEEYAELQDTTSGEYAGIGVEIEAAPTGLRIMHVLEGSPAERAGFKAGEIITSIDGNAVTSLGVDAASEALRGPVGSSVVLLLRAGPNVTRAATLQRDEVALPSVAAEWLAPGIAYLRISSFTDVTAEELEAQLARLQSEPGSMLAGMMLDLRDNPGGVLDSAVALADDFLDSGTIVSADGRAASAQFRAEAHAGDLAHGAPIAVLVNGGSASASEILAAALAENGRATLIGRKTYGKGSVQSIIPLSGGGALKLTTSRYYTPTGVSISGKGIQPEVSLDGAEQAPAPLDQAGSAPTLAQRDQAVSVALATLRGRIRIAAQDPPRPARPHS